MKKTIWLTAITIASVFVTQGSSAAGFSKKKSRSDEVTPANYVGASWGSGEFEGFCGDRSCEDAESSYKTFTGVRLSDTIYLEGSYVKFGAQSAFDAQSQPTSSTVSGYAIGASARMKATDSIDIFGKAGMLWWTNKITSVTDDVEGSREEDGQDLFVGIGADYKLNQAYSIRAEFERFEGIQSQVAGDQAIDLFSLGVSYSSY